MLYINIALGITQVKGIKQIVYSQIIIALKGISHYNPHFYLLILTFHLKKIIL